MHLLALAGALCSAAATIFIRQGLRTSDPFSGFWINLLVGTVSLWTAVLVTGGPDASRPAVRSSSCSPASSAPSEDDCSGSSRSRESRLDRGPLSST